MGILVPVITEPIHDPDTEHTYRRAYRDGWIAATVAFELLLRKTNLHRSDVHDRLWDFHCADLSRWADGDCMERVLPPAFPTFTSKRGNL